MAKQSPSCTFDSPYLCGYRSLGSLGWSRVIGEKVRDTVSPKRDTRGTVSGTDSSYQLHYNDVIMSTIASKITSLTIVYSTVYSNANQRIHQSSASLAIVRGIHRGPVNSPHKWPVTRKMFPFDDIIMCHRETLLTGRGYQWDIPTAINHMCG